MTEKKERIAKVIAGAGLCSRRDAERWIEAGRVSVNGKKLTTPAFTVSDEDQITVDGKPLRYKSATRLWLYHKPAGLVTTAKDPEGRETVFDNLPRTIGRVLSVGRLDMNSEGLLLLTNDGALSRHLELPSTGLPREYRVRVFGTVDDDELAKLEKGVTIDGVRYRGMEIEREEGDHFSRNQWLRIVLHEGKNREIRRVMESINLRVNRLIRTAYGPFELGSLPRGEIKEATGKRLSSFLEDIGFGK
jgi:23S rRNA pseudouridine2605 synthase